MNYDTKVPDSDASKRTAAMASDALKRFREENPEAYRELTETFEGRSADVVLLGNGKFNVSVEKGEVRIEPDVMKGSGAPRGMISPEALMEILEGRRTPLEAFLAGDLVARAESQDLHLAYNTFVKFADTALRSKSLNEMLYRFKETVSFRPTAE